MIRTIITPDTPKISLELPTEYVGKEVEIIAFTKKEASRTDQPTPRSISFEAISINTTGYKFNREEANER